MFKLNKKKRKGFTLIELIIVIVILGILAAIAALKYSDVTRDATASTIKNNMRTIQSAIGIYQAQNGGKNPAKLEDLDSYFQGKSMVNNPKGVTYTIANNKISFTVETGMKFKAVEKLPADGPIGSDGVYNIKILTY